MIVATVSKDTLCRFAAQGHGSQITLVSSDAKQQNRLMAEAFLPTDNAEEEIHLSSQMLLAGMATVDPQLVDSYPDGSRLRATEVQAKQQAVVVWASPAVKNI